jgi:hypothetical protein
LRHEKNPFSERRLIYWVNPDLQLGKLPGAELPVAFSKSKVRHAPTTTLVRSVVFIAALFAAVARLNDGSTSKQNHSRKNSMLNFAGRSADDCRKFALIFVFNFSSSVHEIRKFCARLVGRRETNRKEFPKNSWRSGLAALQLCLARR